MSRAASALVWLAVQAAAPVVLAVRASGQSGVGDLPLVEVVAAQPGRTIAILYSGDGGWAAIDKSVAAALQQRGVSVVGVNSVKYFWRTRTPDGAAADLTRVIRYYASAWKADSVVLVGYSRGAGVVPFLVNRLDADLRSRVRLVALLGAEHTAGFTFHLTDVLTKGAGKDDLPVMPEIVKFGAVPVLCFYGEEERDTLCPELGPPHVVVRLPGGHHLGGNYTAIGERIYQQLRTPAP